MTDIEYKRLILKINDISKNLKREDVYRASKELDLLRKMVSAIKRES